MSDTIDIHTVNLIVDSSIKLGIRCGNAAIVQTSLAAAEELYQKLDLAQDPHCLLLPHHLTNYIRYALEMDPYHQATAPQAIGAMVNRTDIAPNEMVFEQNLAQIVSMLVDDGAQLVDQDNPSASLAQFAFDNSEGNRHYRWPSCVAIVKYSLIEDPTWQPSAKMVFKNLALSGCDDILMQNHQGQMARHFNNLGRAVYEWLSSPEWWVMEHVLPKMEPEQRNFWFENKGRIIDSSLAQEPAVTSPVAFLHLDAPLDPRDIRLAEYEAGEVLRRFKMKRGLG